MPVKSKSRTFKPGEDDWLDVIEWIHNETDHAMDPTSVIPSCKVVKKRLVITITYERDERTDNS
jgi:hypothetical protein